MKVDSIFIDEAKLGQALRQARSRDCNLPGELCLQSPYRGLEVIANKGGVLPRLDTRIRTWAGCAMPMRPLRKSCLVCMPLC